MARGTKLRKYSIVSYYAATFISAITVIYFLWAFKIDVTVPDFFYDADTPRTLLYLTEPSTAISSIRPFLFFISWILSGFTQILPPYFAWSILNLFCILILVLAFRNIFHKTDISPRYTAFLFTNLSVLCWTVVPDTFILGITFFLLGVVLYGDGSKSHRVILSGVVASSLNVFFLFPWLAAHSLLGRKTLVKSAGRAFSVIMAVGSMMFFAQYLSRFKPPERRVELPSSMEKIEPFQDLPFYDASGVFSTVDFMRWFHSPFVGAGENLLTFFTSPWTQGYRYVSGTWAIDSVYLPFAFLFLAVLLTAVSYFGIFLMHVEHRTFMLFLFCLEISTCLLFLTYSTHPFLFAPFLLASRVSGLVYFGHKFESAFLPLVLVSSFMTIFSLQYMP